MSVQLVYETHSTSVDNEVGRATGWLGGTLSETGREQARLLGERRRNDGIDLVVASDLNRAVETARIAFDGSAIPVTLDWRLRECDYGSMNGMPQGASRRGAAAQGSTRRFPAARAGARQSHGSSARSTRSPGSGQVSGCC